MGGSTLQKYPLRSSVHVHSCEVPASARARYPSDARDLLSTADPALADRVSYDSELSMLCVLCQSRADARLTVNLLR